MSETTNQPCRRDEDCDVDPTTNLCRKCGVEHGEPCPECGGRGYHRDDCLNSRAGVGAYVCDDLRAITTWLRTIRAVIPEQKARGQWYD